MSFKSLFLHGTLWEDEIEQQEIRIKVSVPQIEHIENLIRAYASTKCFEHASVKKEIITLLDKIFPKRKYHKAKK